MRRLLWAALLARRGSRVELAAYARSRAYRRHHDATFVEPGAFGTHGTGH